jgi:hypothetical protein
LLSTGNTKGLVPRVAMSNEEFITKFRDWRSAGRATEGKIEQEVSFISRLAEFMAPLPVSKATKAVTHDFYWNEEMAAGRKNVVPWMMLDAFLADLRRMRRKH